MPDSHDELRKIEDALAALEELRGTLPDEQIEAMKAPLLVQRNTVINQSGGVNISTADAVNVGRDVIGRDKNVTIVHGSLYQTLPGSISLPEARRRYLLRLRRACEVLPLAALGGEEGVDEEITLGSVYVALDTTTPVPLSAEEQKQHQAQRLTPRDADSRPLTALEAATQSPRLVLLGDPGAGKSTFARMLLARLASANLGEADPPPGCPADLLPVLIVLRDLAPRLTSLDLDALPGDRQRESLAAAVRDQAVADLARLEASDFADGLREALDASHCLLVLDGLDEVPHDLRGRIRQATVAVASHYRLQRLLLTCRVRSYLGEAVLPDFQSHTLAPFDDEKIQSFAVAWYNAQKQLGRVDAEQVKSKAEDLSQAALSADLRELSENPMMLTTMALIHQQEIALPKQRVRLYKMAVDVLLRRWQKRKTGDAAARDSALADFHGDDLRLRAVMERLAYEAHRTGRDDREAADLLRGDALTLLEKPEYLGSAGLAAEFLDYVDQRAGLLVGRGGEPGRPLAYSFPHLTFQEYLAGSYLAGQRDTARALFVHAGEAGWELAAQLGAEELLFNRFNPNGLLDLAYRLCPAQEPATPQARRALLWGSKMAALAGREMIERDTDSPDGGLPYLNRLVPRLIALLGSDLTAPERADAGDTLARLGDPRDLEALLPIPAGPFRMGSDKTADAEAYDDELPQHEVFLSAFKIGQYLVTVGAWKQFVEASGYVCDPDSLRGLANHPAHDVSWHDACTYCDWLTKAWRAAGKIAPDELVRLPTEAEWEKAARGADGRIYPWGNDFDPNKTNVYETSIGQTCAVGCFSGGASPYGALDMSGNVWEWTQSQFAKYPYDGQDGREDLQGDRDRVLRGGAFYFSRRFARCAYRSYYRAVNRSFYLGFRLVVSPGSRP